MSSRPQLLFLFVLTVSGLAALAPAQHPKQRNVFQPRTSSPRSTRAWSLTQARRRNAQPDFEARFRASRQRTADLKISKPWGSRNRRGADPNFDETRPERRDSFHDAFRHLAVVSVDTNFALHGAEMGMDNPLFDGDQELTTRGLYLANDCSSHGYVVRVNLRVLKFGRNEDCRRRHIFDNSPVGTAMGITTDLKSASLDLSKGE